jgi:hypothetical protein
MSIAVLKAIGTHGYRDDMESFFYVFLWICCGWDMPGKEKNKHPLNRWISDDPLTTAYLKRGMMSHEEFEMSIISLISGYFTEPVTTLALKLRGLIFDEQKISETELKNGVTQCFADAIRKLEEAEGLVKKFDRLDV